MYRQPVNVPEDPRQLGSDRQLPGCILRPDQTSMFTAGKCVLFRQGFTASNTSEHVVAHQHIPPSFQQPDLILLRRSTAASSPRTRSDCRRTTGILPDVV